MKVLLALVEALRRTNLGLVVGSEGSIAVSDACEPMPDIILYDPTHLPADYDGPIPAAAVKLVVEVATTTLGDDLGEKLEDDASAGLAEHWVVDVKDAMVFRHDGPGPTGYARRLAVRFDEPLSALTLPGLALPAGVIS